MKRVGNLWTKLISWTNLFAAAQAAMRGKRDRPDVALFALDLENQIAMLARELEAGDYRPGAYRCFRVREPKPRLISAAPFRDRVVHHALIRVLEPIFERRFTLDSFACRKGLGTHRAIQRAHSACQRYPFLLKCDLIKYFPSIDHAILKELLARAVKCQRTLALAGDIIDSSNPQEPATAYFPGDDLFTPGQRRRGLPLGNQTSQFFANVYLNPLDHFVARVLKPAYYVRYVDDFLLFGEDKHSLHEMRLGIEEFLCGLRLRLHARKCRVHRADDGVSFLGWRVFPDRLRLIQSNVVGFRRRLRSMQRAYGDWDMNWEDIHPRVLAWIAHAAHGDTWKLRQKIFRECSFTRGVRPNARRFLEQQCEERPRVESQQEPTW